MIYEKYIRVLYINCDTKKIKIEQRTDLLEYLGGVGVASKLLDENMKPELDPLDPAQPIVLATGAATTVFPVITKTVAMFISPLTRELGESYAGGRLAMCLFYAGYDAVVITGKLKDPSYINITTHDISFKDARAIWGTDADGAGNIIRAREIGSGGKRSIIRIGVAGENQVHYASVCVDTYRHFGRMGLGAVFGSKNIKAIQVVGDRQIPAENQKEYFKVYQDIYKKVTSTDIMGKYHDLGTAINVEPLSNAGGLPTLNLTQTSYDKASEISGEQFAQKHLVRKMACTGCPVGCIHIGQIRREFDKGHEYEKRDVCYDYELIFALGSYLGIDNTQEILEVIDDVERAGLDAMSTGVCLGWATEAFRDGLVSESDTIIPLEFGNAEMYKKAIWYISSRKNFFWSSLANGCAYAAKMFGGSEYAMSIAGNETPGYHTGYGSLIGAAAGARHSHLCNGGYSVDQSFKSFDPIDFDKEELVDKLFKEEKERCMLNSLIICLFARKVYDRPTIIAALSSIGLTYTDEQLSDVAGKILALKMQIKRRLGFKLEQIVIPKRFFETPSLVGKLDENIAKELLSIYQRKCDELEKSFS